MTTAVGLGNLVLGTVYTCYGLMTIVDLRRGWSSDARSFRHFGFAWLAMAFTCGPHHLDHAAHVLIDGRTGGALDLLAVVVGLPAGIGWFLLRVEAMRGGSGDRFLEHTPRWLEHVPLAAAVYLAALATGTGRVVDGSSFDWRVTPNLALVALYGAIGAVLAATQVRNHQVTGGWSVSGTSLAAVMFTCAVMHGVYGAYGTAGDYDFDWHGLAIAFVSVPAAAYFLWVVVSIHQGRWQPHAERGVQGGPVRTLEGAR